MKTQTKPATKHLVSLLGGLGTLLCLVAGLGVWFVEWRVDRARGKLFERVEQALSRINSRLIETQNLAAKSKITVEEIQQRMLDRAKKEASDRLIDRTDVDARIQQLATGLRQVELMLEISHETAVHVRQVLEVGAELGVSLNADSIDPLLERIAGIKEDVSQAINTAESLGKRIGVDDADDSTGARGEQIVAIAGRLLATFGKVDSRLESFRGELVDAQDAMKRLNFKTRAYVVAAAVCTTLFLLWMAAGQVSMWRRARSC